MKSLHHLSKLPRATWILPILLLVGCPKVDDSHKGHDHNKGQEHGDPHTNESADEHEGHDHDSGQDHEDSHKDEGTDEHKGHGHDEENSK